MVQIRSESMARRPQNRERTAAPAAETTAPTGRRELVVMTRPEAAVRVQPGGAAVAAAAESQAAPLTNLLAQAGVTLTPVFGPSEDRVRLAMAAAEAEAAARGDYAAVPPVRDLSTFYYAEA